MFRRVTATKLPAELKKKKKKDCSAAVRVWPAGSVTRAQ